MSCSLPSLWTLSVAPLNVSDCSTQSTICTYVNNWHSHQFQTCFHLNCAKWTSNSSLNWRPLSANTLSKGCPMVSCACLLIVSNQIAQVEQFIQTMPWKWCSMFEKENDAVCHHQRSPADAFHLQDQHCVHALLTITTHLLNHSISWSNTVFTFSSLSASALTCWIVPSPEPTLCSCSPHTPRGISWWLSLCRSS